MLFSPALPQLDRLRRLAHPLLPSSIRGAQHRHQPLIPIHRPLERRQPLTGELQESSRRARRLRHPGRARSNPQRRRLVEPAHPRRRQRREMQPMLVVRIQAVVVQVHRDDVRQRQLVHLRPRMPRPMKHKRNQRQRLAQPQRHPRLHQHPLRFRSRRFGPLASAHSCQISHLHWGPHASTVAAGGSPDALPSTSLSTRICSTISVSKLILGGLPARRCFTQHHQRQHIPPIHPFHPPVDDVLRRIQRRIDPVSSCPSARRLPSPPASRPAQPRPPPHHILGVVRQRRAQHVGVIRERLHRFASALAAFRRSSRTAAAGRSDPGTHPPCARSR